MRDFKELIKGEKSYVLIPSLGTIHMTLETILGIQEDVKNLSYDSSLWGHQDFPQLPWEFPVVGRAAMFLLGIVLDVRGKTTFLK